MSLANDIIIEEKLELWKIYYGKETEKFSSFLDKFDRIYWFSSNWKEINKSLKEEIKVKTKFMYPFPSQNSQVWIYEYCLSILDHPLTSKEWDSFPKCFIGTEVKFKNPQKIIAWHPGAGSLQKQIDQKIFYLILNELKKVFDFKLAIILGPAESKDFQILDRHQNCFRPLFLRFEFSHCC